MVTQTVMPNSINDISDGGYTPAGVTNDSAIIITRFTNIAGQVNFDATDAKVKYRAHTQGYVDTYFTTMPARLSMKKMTKQQYIASFPSNVWLSQMKFEGDQELKKIF